MSSLFKLETARVKGDFDLVLTEECLFTRFVDKTFESFII